MTRRLPASVRDRRLRAAVISRHLTPRVSQGTGGPDRRCRSCSSATVPPVSRSRPGHNGSLPALGRSWPGPIKLALGSSRRLHAPQPGSPVSPGEAGRLPGQPAEPVAGMPGLHEVESTDVPHPEGTAGCAVRCGSSGPRWKSPPPRTWALPTGARSGGCSNAWSTTLPGTSPGCLDHPAVAAARPVDLNMVRDELLATRPLASNGCPSL